MSFGIFTCCLSRAYTVMEKSNNTRLYAVHVQPLRPSPAEAPSIGKIHPSGKMAVSFEPLLGFWCLSGYRNFSECDLYNFHVLWCCFLCLFLICKNANGFRMSLAWVAYSALFYFALAPTTWWCATAFRLRMNHLNK